LRRWDDWNFEATLTVGLPPVFTETYVSAVTVNPQTLVVETKSIESRLFDALSSRWKLSHYKTDADEDECFDPNNRRIPEQQQYQCHVYFQVEMTVRDPLIQSTLDRVLEQIAGKQVEAFATRCQELPLIIDHHFERVGNNHNNTNNND
jgi:ribosome-associated toxin RatA of RatAB toxin-antitoxin module